VLLDKEVQQEIKEGRYETFCTISTSPPLGLVIFLSKGVFLENEKGRIDLQGFKF